MNNLINWPLNQLGVWLPVIGFVAIWSLVWKGLALWKAARADSPGWFVMLLIINTAGILEILYIYVFSKSSELGKK